MSDTPKPRRSRNPARIREGARAIGAALDAHIPPPEPAGLGEGMLLRARRETMRNDAMDSEVLGRIMERSEANGKTLDGLAQRLDRIDGKLEGVAYQRDIAHFMVRTEIESKIDRAERDAKDDAAKAVAAVKADVSELRGLVKWAGMGITTALVGILVKMILTAAHVTA